VYELVETGGGGAEYVPVVAAVYGAALYACGRVLRDELYSGPMRGVGFALAAAGTFVFTFREAVEQLDRDTGLGAGELIGLVGLGGAALAGAVVVAARATRWFELAEAALIAAVPLLVGAAILVPEGGDAIVYPILFNLLVAAIALGAIAAGSVREEAWLVNSGIALVAVDVFARYIDVFWDLLPRSLGFLGAGLILLALAFGLERQRARLVGRMEA
jgi:hypothetical protein